MHAFINHRSSCFLDTLLVAMFTTTTSFDHLFHPHDNNNNNNNNIVARTLEGEVRRLRSQEADTCGWKITTLRNLLGSPWNNGHPQSAVDFLHALLDALEVKSLGTLRHVIAYLPHTRTTMLNDVRMSNVEGFRMQLAVAGQHASLVDVFKVQKMVLPPGAESYATVNGIILEDAPVLVFEVGRNDSTARVEYGSTAARAMRIFILVKDVEYTLVGVVCRTNGHYMGFVWGEQEEEEGCGWGVYDDAQENGAIVKTGHPENHSKGSPSRFGELFFYVRACKK